MNDGDNFTKTLNYTVTLEARCNPNMNDTHLKWISNKIDKKSNSANLIFESPEACPKADFYNVMLLIKNSVYIIAPVTIVLGIFLAMFGSKFVIVTIFIFSCAITIILLFFLVFQLILPSGSSQVVVWIVLALSIIIGIVVGVRIYNS